MSASKRTHTLRLRTCFQIFIIALCISHAKSEKVSVSKEGLREEQLLPVRMTREVSEGGVEGSGDDDSTPIKSLRNRMMERMTLKEDDNKISDESSEDAKSKEIIEEGSGFGDATPKVDTAPSTEANNTAETFDEDATEEKDVDDVELINKEDEETTTETKVTEISLDATTAKEETTLLAETSATGKITETTTETVAPTEVVPTEVVPTEEVTTEAKEEVTERAEVTILPEIKVEDKTEAEEEVTERAEVTILPEVKVEDRTEAREEVTEGAGVTILPEVKVEDRTEAETTTAKAETTTEEPKEVTEVVEMKRVKPIFAVEITTQVPEPATEATEEPATTTVVPPVKVPDNVTFIENENLTAGTDTLLMKIKSKLLDTKDTDTDSSKDPSRLGTYIVISLILLSFLSLIGFILMKRRVQKRRKKSNIDPDTLDTEKALLSLSEYKDHPDGLDEGKIKNNEITPIVIKSNAKINKFEKNTNFSSPKNLNTKANEKNVEKDNVLKKASDNLTHVIIEDPTKDVEEEKTQSNAEKLIVRTHLDQDSIPKKPVIINRTSLGCVPVSQD